MNITRWIEGDKMMVVRIRIILFSETTYLIMMRTMNVLSLFMLVFFFTLWYAYTKMNLCVDIQIIKET